MRKFVVFSILISYASLVNAQIDSIRKEMHKHPNQLDLKFKLGQAYNNNGKIDTAEILFNEVINTAIRSNDNENFILANIQEGRICADRGENVKALNHYEQALSKAETINNKEYIAHIYKNIGAVYISWKKFDQALGYYDKAEELAAITKDDELVADCQNNKGTVYEQQLKYDKAIVAYANALDDYTRKNITAKVSMALSNLAIVYKYKKDYKTSLAYNFKALALSAKTQDRWMMAATYNNIGNLYGEMGDYKNAVLYCKKALAIAQQINAIEIVESIYDSLSDAAAKAGDYKSAFMYHKKFSDASSKFINIESARQLSELNLKFETERKQKLIHQQQFEITKRNYWLFGALMLLALVSIVGYLVFRNNKYKQDQRLIAEVHKQQEIATRSLFEGEQKERIRIARDLHDSIGQMLTVVKMNVSTLGEQYKDDSRIANTGILVDKTITEVRHISHNLIPEELAFGLFAAIEDMCEKINAAGGTQVELTVPDEAREHTFERSNELSIYRIVQEVLSNMVKHGQASKIELNVSHQPHSGLTLSIKDNGKGFDTSKIAGSKGLGWKNIVARVNLLDGNIQVRSEKLIGTQIEIAIPG
ncbi:MAG: tetratricopeptide repeat protein [Mucilaginibacter sp.]